MMPMKDFSHILLTRFNVRIDYGRYQAPDAEWLRHRFALFERYCLPSVRSQTRQDFKWLVFFDAETPEEFRERIAAYAQWPAFKPCFVESADKLGLGRLIPENAAPAARWLITSRIDNDDAMAVNYIAEVERQFAGQDFEFINFPDGLILSRGRLYAKRNASNQFISLIERREGFRTVWCGQHQELSLLGPVKQVEMEPLWLEIIHERNVGNRVGSRPRVPLGTLEGRFAIGEKLDFAAESDFALKLDNAGRALRRAMPIAWKDPLLKGMMTLRRGMSGK